MFLTSIVSRKVGRHDTSGGGVSLWGGAQMHGIEEARHLARDFCQDTLSEHFLRPLSEEAEIQGQGKT